MNLGVGLIESVIFGAKTLSFINSISMDVIGKTISVTTSSIGSMISHFASMDQPGIVEFQKALEDVDLDFKVGVLEELVKEQKGSAPVSVKKALMGVNDVLIKIDVELKTIKEAFEYHQTKYFNSWRTFDCSCNVETIKRHSKLLDKRTQILTELLKIYNVHINQNLVVVENEVDNCMENEKENLEKKSNSILIEDLS
jgi:hypothetical protein